MPLSKYSKVTPLILPCPWISATVVRVDLLTAVVGAQALGQLRSHRIVLLLSTHEPPQQRQHEQLRHKAGGHRMAVQQVTRWSLRHG